HAISYNGVIAEKVFDLKTNLKYNASAHHILDLIENRKYKLLCRNKYIYDLDVAFCFDKEEFLFLDIETLGLYDSPIIMIGWERMDEVPTDEGNHLISAAADKDWETPLGHIY
ncbi:unnamed protein product, partial [marine sediment metagenome]